SRTTKALDVRGPFLVRGASANRLLTLVAAWRIVLGALVVLLEARVELVRLFEDERQDEAIAVTVSAEAAAAALLEVIKERACHVAVVSLDDLPGLVGEAVVRHLIRDPPS